MRVFRMGTCSKRDPVDTQDEIVEIPVTNIAEVTSSSRISPNMSASPKIAASPKLSISPKMSISPTVPLLAPSSPKLSVSPKTPYNHRDMDSGYSDADSDEEFDTLGDIYTLGVTESNDKAALYGRMMHYYAEPSGNLPHPHRTRSKSVLWYMLAILISNPIIGLYTMRHFKDWDTWVTRNVTVDERLSTGDNASFNRSTWDIVPKWTASSPSGGNGTWSQDDSYQTSQDINGSSDDSQDEATPTVVSPCEYDTLSTMAKHFARKVTWYAYYEVFGELVFALFSLALLCTSGMCCHNGEHRVQSMIPVIGLLYTIIYKMLAMYVLIISLKIIFFYFVAGYPQWASKLPQMALRLLAVAGTDPSQPLQRAAMTQLLQLDRVGHRWVLVYCLENVYITITESIETTYALFKIFMRLMRKIIRKIRRQQELVYFTVSSPSEVESTVAHPGGCSCSYILLDSLLNKAAAPQESYIHQMYNAKTDVGTYLANVDVEMYQHSIEQVGAKLLNKLKYQTKT
ncbi:major schizont surface protein p104, putative [Babesia ovis]|uniref:Major schizont surface protein p104, putative n=1 Tax=Babesia ovis TaxID=5869 RepID=A0A9W5WVQ3_BABOV|nr:major schizont surface protein p104, putative [Babesia ovis]